MLFCPLFYCSSFYFLLSIALIQDSQLTLAVFHLSPNKGSFFFLMPTWYVLPHWTHIIWPHSTRLRLQSLTVDAIAVILLLPLLPSLREGHTHSLPPSISFHRNTCTKKTRSSCSNLLETMMCYTHLDYFKEQPKEILKDKLSLLWPLPKISI